MRSVLAFGLSLCLLHAVRADEDARAIIKKGLAAQGGPLSKGPTFALFVRREGSHITHGDGDEKPHRSRMLDSEYWIDERGRERSWAKWGSAGEEATEMLSVNDGKKRWQKFGDGPVREEPEKQFLRERMNLYFDRVGWMHGILDDKALGFKALGESKRDGKAVLGVRVTRKGSDDVLLYFDKRSALLVERVSSVFDTDEDEEKKATLHWRMSDYREVDHGAADEALLKGAGLGVTAKELLALVRGRAVTPDAVKRAKELVARLNDDDFDAREKATEALVELGSAAVAELRAARKSADPEVARRASRCLLRINPARQERTTLAAARLLAARRVDGACGPLLALLPGADEALTREVCVSLHHLALRDGKPDPALVAALKDADKARRAGAEKALEKDGGAFAKKPGRRLYPAGQKFAMKLTISRDGKKTDEYEIKEVAYFNTFEDAIFERP
jgi:hypothetical protein